MTTPPAGGGYRLSLKDGVWHSKKLPAEQPTADERKVFTRDGYYPLSRLELMRRLRGAEWDAAERKRQLDEYREGARYQRTADARTLARVAGLVDHTRKTLRMHDLRLALGLIRPDEE